MNSFDLQGIATMAHKAGINFGSDLNLHTLWRFAEIVESVIRRKVADELAGYIEDNIAGE